MMKRALSITYFLIGFSYTFLLYNKIAFGFALLLGLVPLFLLKKKNLNFKFKFKFENKNVDLFFFITIIFFLISSYFSIKPERSILVVLYFIVFIIISLNLFFLLIKDDESYKKILNCFILSTLINIVIIFFYDVYQSGILTGDFHQGAEIRRYKGVLNIISILIILLFFFKKSKFFFIPVLFLLPSLYLSNSNAPILGFLVGILLIIIFRISQRFYVNKAKILGITIFLSIFAVFFAKQLPQEFDINSVKKQNFTIPISILDAHRQFIWGFSLSKFIQKPFLGYGPDTSNFIEDGQKVIGSEHTGTMKFIPSHPHNFFIELLLETGLLGTFSFIIFIILLNYRIFIKANYLDKNFLIFFNGYYWGASLVNFSYWQAWWQGSYFLILCLIASKIIRISESNSKVNS